MICFDNLFFLGDFAHNERCGSLVEEESSRKENITSSQ